jgi:hypothetical protein
MCPPKIEFCVSWQFFTVLDTFALYTTDFED